MCLSLQLPSEPSSCLFYEKFCADLKLDYELLTLSVRQSEEVLSGAQLAQLTLSSMLLFLF